MAQVANWRVRIHLSAPLTVQIMNRSNMRGPHDDSQSLRAEARGGRLVEFAPVASYAISAIAATGRIDRHDEVLQVQSPNSVPERRVIDLVSLMDGLMEQRR